jgi:hypothetical protein
LTVALALCAMLALPQPSDALLIDDFSDTTVTWPQVLLSPPGDLFQEYVVGGTVSGDRETRVDGISPEIEGLDSLRLSIDPPASVFDYQSSLGMTARVTLFYGFSELNLDLSGDVGIEVEFAGFDAPEGPPLIVNARLHQFQNGIIAGPLQVAASVSSGGPQVARILFSSDDAFLSDIDQITIEFGFQSGGIPAGADFRVAEIRTFVPEPSTGVLLTAALVGLAATAAWHRRRVAVS